MIAQHQSGHCFHDWNRTRKNARIMAPARSQPGSLARTRHCLLFVGDRSCWLKRDAKINLFSVTDSALYATGIVGRRANFSASHLEWIVMLGTAQSRRRKTRTD